MLTVKHIRIGGDEDILAASGVRFTPSCGAYDETSAQYIPATLWVRDGADERPLTGGTIFVMNDSGKTVSRYDLGASPVPFVGDGLADTRCPGYHHSGEQSLGLSAPRAPRTGGAVRSDFRFGKSS
jgi:hypothetical protein